MTDIDSSKKYIKYAEDVLSGKIVAGKYIKLACKRYIDWFSREDVYFDYDDVDTKIRLIELLKLQEGGYFVLLPYQAWIISAIFGFYYKGDDRIRVINNVLLLTARKSGKSTFASAIAIAMAIADKEKSPEIAFIANSAKQASLLFKYCSRLCNSIDPNKQVFKRMRSDIRIPRVDGQITILSSDTSKLDGRSDSLFIEDEGHEAKTFEIWNVLKTGQGARKNPLAISISTAGFNIGTEYPLYNQWEYCCNILDGTYDDDTWAAFIFQLDDGDDWTDEKVWIKANPSLGTTVSYKYMRDQIRSAQQTSANEVSIKTKNLNMWCQSSDIWISDKYLLPVMQTVNIDDYQDEESFLGVDLSAVSDLTSTTIMFPPNPDRKVHPDKFVFKSYMYLPESCLEENVNAELYKIWKRNKQLIMTSGNVVDYDFILKDQIKLFKNTYMVNVAYDQWNSSQWAINATEEGLPLVPYSQAVGNFNKPTKFLEMLIRQGKVVIDNNSLVKWCFGNVSLKIDSNENCKPVKTGGDRSKKIDPVISMIQALGGYLDNTNYSDGEALSVKF